MAQARSTTVVLLIVCYVACVRCDQIGLEEQLQTLSKQVTALLEKREEDLKSIEENMRKRLEFGGVQEELQKLRVDLENLRSSNSVDDKPLTNHEKNDKRLVKWLTTAVKELKTEVLEVQNAINSTIILQNHEMIDTDISLLKTDVTNLNRELETSKAQNAKFEAEITSLRDELTSLRDSFKATSVSCGKTKNQLKALQLEFHENLKLSQELLSENDPHPRHHRLIKEHIVGLEKSSKIFTRENYILKKKIHQLEREIKAVRQMNLNRDLQNDFESNELQNNVQGNFQKLLANVTKQNELNSVAINNLTTQLSNFDKLHMSMLELLENVESVEAKVDRTSPEFRKEISKLEVQIAQTNSTISILKEDFKNTRVAVKAISASVSNLQDGFKGDHAIIKDLNNKLESLKKLTSLHSSKLHGHILKTESAIIDPNSTKSAIHLVDELESFEDGYKNIINKLPKDCSSVLGPKGIYLISPGEGKPVLAPCDKGWTTIQRRYDGSVNFYRDWGNYSKGFGSVDGELWLGNKNMHYITRNNCTTLQINLEDIYGNHWQANYDDFRVADESNGFRLFVGNYSGNASNALDYQNNMEFSTVDNDRDISNTHCALNYEGGWWFSHCQHANLNGRYNLGLTWFDNKRNEWIAVSKSEMRVKVRPNC